MKWISVTRSATLHGLGTSPATLELERMIGRVSADVRVDPVGVLLQDARDAGASMAAWRSPLRLMPSTRIRISLGNARAPKVAASSPRQVAR